MLSLVQSLRSKNLSDQTLSADVKRHLANMVINKEMKSIDVANKYNIQYKTLMKYVSKVIRLCFE